METALFMVIAFAAFIYLVEPILSPRKVEASAAGDVRAQDSAALVLDEIVDLDLEHAAGKISNESYATVRQRLVAEAAVVMEAGAHDMHPAIDGETPSSPASASPTCARCGAVAGSGDRFCADCGNALTSKKETS